MHFAPKIFFSCYVFCFVISHLVHVAARSNLVTAFRCLQEVNQLAVDVYLVTIIIMTRREIVMIMRQTSLVYWRL